MAEPITLTMDGLLLNWLKNVGDKVSAGDVVAEFEADKATVEVEAPSSGVIVELKAQPGDELTEGTVIAMVGEAGEAPSNGADQAEPAAETKSENGKAEAEPAAQKSVSAGSNGAAQSASVTEEGRVKASPLARNIAADRGIDLSQVPGTGPGGRITKSDVEDFEPGAAPAPAAGAPGAAPSGAGIAARSYGKLPEPSEDVEILDINRMRRAIADGTILSKQTTPHFYVTVEIDVAALLELRKELNTSLEDSGIKISVNDMLVKAAALTLRKFPNLNSHYYGDKIVRYKRINIGISVALPNNGLINVVAHDADRMSLSALAVNNKAMYDRAREGKIKPEDIRGATFTISNLGPYDVDEFSAIISTPEAGILAISSARKVPVVLEDGSLGVGHRMKATISVDHRVSDGAEGAQYMQEFKALLEHPMRLLV